MTPSPPYTHRAAPAFAGVVALFVTVLVALSLPGTAAASACGDKVLEDWYDNGRVDRLYPPHCYEDAIDAIPKDIKDYVDAEEVISRALQFSLRDEIAPGGKDPTPGDDNPDGSLGNDKGGKNNGGTNTGGTNNGGSEVTPDVDTSGPSSVPIPLLVLGGMSLALLAAGGLGYLSRRRQAARVDDLDDEDTLL